MGTESEDKDNGIDQSGAGRVEAGTPEGNGRAAGAAAVIPAPERAHADTEQGFSLAFENALDAIFWADAATGTIVRVNRAAEELVGRPRSELLGMSQMDLHPADKRELYRAMFEQHARHRIPEPKEAVVAHASGREIPALISPSLTRINGRDIIQGVFRNIEDAIKARQALEAERRKFSALLESTPAFICSLDQSLTVRYANSVFTKQFGTPANRKCHDILCGRPAPCPHCPIERLFDKDSDGEEITRECADARGRIHKVYMKAYTDETGARQALVTGFDITELKFAKMELEAKNTLLNTLLDTIPAPVFFKDASGRYLGCNKAFEEHAGTTREQLTGKTVFDLWPPELAEIYHEADTSLLREPGRQSYEGQMDNPRTGLRDVIFHKATFNNPDGSVGGLLGITVDITERKAMERRIAQQERFVSSILGSLPSNICIVDGQGAIRYTNAAWDRFSGENGGREDYKDWNYFQICEAAARRGDALAHDAAHGIRLVLDGKLDEFRLEYPCNSPEQPRWFSMIARPLDGSDSGRVVIAHNDITERKLAEEAMAQSENRLKDFMNNAKDLIQMVNCEGQFLFVNNEWTRTLGYSEEEALSMRFLDIVHPDRRSHCQDVFMEVISGKNIPLVETVFVAKDGRAIAVEGTVNCRFVNGAPVSTRAIFRDVTERKLMEDALRLSEGRLRTITETAQDAIIMIDEKGNISFWNPAAARMFGYSQEEATGQNLHRLLAPAEFHEAHGKAFASFQKTGEGAAVGKTLELAAMNKNGDRFPIELSLAARRLPRGWGAVGIIRDITERNKAREQLRQAMDDLERSNKELEEFAYVASHDLKEPLRMVVSYMQLLERRYKGQLDEKADKFIGYAVDGAMRMQKLISALLDYSRVGRVNGDFETVDCNALIERIASDLGEAVKEKNARITYSELPEVQAAPALLGQLLQNLVANGLKYCTDPAPHVHVSAERGHGEWVFSVRDNGIGIPPEHHERIFKIFQRLHTRDEFQGTGIGLSVCKKAVEYHHGRIWVESDHGLGSTFFFTIPDREAGS